METISKSKWNEKVFVINNNNKPELMTYGEYVREFGGDETTSPRGVEPRIHIREKDYSGYVENEAGEEVFQEDIKYQVWSWGTGGNHPSFTGAEFDTKEEAENDVYEHFEYNAQNHNDNAPGYYSTEEEAEAEIADRMHYAMDIDINVAQSIYSKTKRLNERRNELKQIAEVKRIEEKIESEKFIQIEAEKLFSKRGEVENLFKIPQYVAPDNKYDFQAEIKAKREHNILKQNKQVADMKNLISHAGIEGGILKAPFWSVFKAVSKMIYENK